MSKYNLGFISDEAFLAHVTNTIDKYRFDISLNDFNGNIVDPIKMTFDSKVYGKNIRDLIDMEATRQIDKLNANHIGYFHQNIFYFVGNGWTVPKKGFDVVNDELAYYVKFNLGGGIMGAAEVRKTYIKMQGKLIDNSNANCFLVEEHIGLSHNMPWILNTDGTRYMHQHIRRISIDKFYEIVSGDTGAYSKICCALPLAIDDAFAIMASQKIENIFIRNLERIKLNLNQQLNFVAF